MPTIRRASADAAELVRLLGMPGAYELLRRFVGTAYVYIPKQATPHNRLTLVLGIVDAQKLSESYGGLLLKLPQDRALVMNDRNARITKLVEQTGNFSEVGRAFGLTRQQIKNIVVGDTAGKRNK